MLLTYDFTMIALVAGGSSSRSRKKRGEDVVHSLQVSLEDLYNGATKKHTVSRNILCQKCKGYILCLNMLLLLISSHCLSAQKE